VDRATPVFWSPTLSCSRALRATARVRATFGDGAVVFAACGAPFGVEFLQPRRSRQPAHERREDLRRGARDSPNASCRPGVENLLLGTIPITRPGGRAHSFHYVHLARARGFASIWRRPGQLGGHRTCG